MPPPNPTHRIYPDWKEVLVYEESPERLIRFQCDCVEPYQVHVPTGDLWAHRTPAWAWDHRDVILARLRAANCIICEESDGTTSIHSPDGTFRVEVYYELEERGFARRALRIITMDGHKLADIDDAYPTGVITFPQPGQVILPIQLRSNRYQIGVDIPNRSSWIQPNEIPRPLDQLLPLLASQNPPPAIRLFTPPAPRSLVGSIGLLLGCLGFIAAGIWQALAGETRHDRWIGILCSIFFTFCIAAPISDLRRWMKHRDQ